MVMRQAWFRGWFGTSRMADTITQFPLAGMCPKAQSGTGRPQLVGSGANIIGQWGGVGSGQWLNRQSEYHFRIHEFSEIQAQVIGPQFRKYLLNFWEQRIQTTRKSHA